MIRVHIDAINFWLLCVVMVNFWHDRYACLNQTLIKVSFVLQASFLLVHALDTGHFPLSNLYESLLCLSCVLTFLIGWINYDDVLAYILMPSVALLQIFTVGLPLGLKAGNALVPALQSNWLQMHVMVMIGAYACLMLGGLLAVIYLIFFYYYDRLLPYKILLYWSGGVENMSYRLIGLGFAFLTAGLLSGAVWANQTWGSYWSWDPKETWALITWLIFAMYLHVRLSDKYHKVRSAWLAVSGWIVLWICYLGVNLMAKGLHSYGFLS